MTQKQRPGQKVKLISVDELLKVPDGEIAEEIKIDEIHPFANHPFRVQDDERMNELVESIRRNGILTPVIIRQDPIGGYEMISGHRRMHAAKRLGMDSLPAVIKNLDDDDASIVMVDTNLQREELLPSEKAFAYKIKYDAVRHKVGRPAKNSDPNKRILPTPEKKLSQNETISRTDTMLAESIGVSRSKLHRYLRLAELPPDILELLDTKRITFIAAYEISLVPQEVQKYIGEYIHENGVLKFYQVEALRRYLQSHDSISQKALITLFNDSLPGRSNSTPKKLSFTEKKLRSFFDSNYSMDDMEKIILRLLAQWKEKQEGEANEV